MVISSEFRMRASWGFIYQNSENTEILVHYRFLNSKWLFGFRLSYFKMLKWFSSNIFEHHLTGHLKLVPPIIAFNYQNDTKGALRNILVLKIQ